MRALFLFLRVVASLISVSFVVLGSMSAVLAVWLVWQLPRAGTGAIGLVMASFGALMLYLGIRVVREQARMYVSWWRSARRERLLPSARLVVR
jgi:hypothetical protein